MMLRLEQHYKNTLTEISKLINGLTVLIHEVEGGVEDLGGIGFVSDVVIFMSCKIVNNLILRDMEIKKSRGSPTRIAKVIFTIEEGEGIKVFVPLMLEEVPAPDYTKPYNHLCNSLNRKVGPIYPGEIIFLVHPNLAYVDYVLAYLTLTAIIYKAKILIISYLIPPQHIIQRILKSLEIITTKSSITEELINNYVVIKGLNPSAHLPEEAVCKVVKLLMDYKPAVVVFIGTPPLGIKPTGVDTNYNNLIVNLIFYLRKLRITTVIVDDHDNELVKVPSDMFIRVKKCVKGKIFRIPRVSVEILRKSEIPTP
jgi:circadian clock protein KaiC